MKPLANRKVSRRSALALAGAAVAMAAVGGGAVGCQARVRVPVTLAVAASLRKVVPALIAAFLAQQPGANIRAAYGASGDLRKRVKDGAPVDAVLLASGQPVDDLIAAGYVVADSRKVVAGNQLVLIAKTKRPLTFQTLAQLPADEKLALGDPGSVPAGRYARDMLKRLGQWQALDKRLVLAGDVSAVLAYARRGEVAAAIVYATEVRGIDDVVVLDRARGAWAPQPEVVVGLVKDGTHQEQARAFLAFVASARGQAIFADHGFGAPPAVR